MPVGDDFAPRRVVTGIGVDGRSAVLFDDRVALAPYGPIEAGAAWRVERVPAPDSGGADLGAAGPSFLAPGSAGLTVFRIPEGDPEAPPPMFATATIDFIVMLTGRAELFTESGSTIVAAGDLVVDRGVMHGWRAIGPEPAYSVVANVPAEMQG